MKNINMVDIEDFIDVKECIEQNQIEKAKDYLRDMLDVSDDAGRILGLLESNEIYLAHEIVCDVINKYFED